MINIVSGGTYYFPKSADYPAAHYTLFLYSDLTKTEAEYDLLINQLVDTEDYIACYVRDEQFDEWKAGEYNYRLLDGNLHNEVSRGLIRVVKDDEGDYDPTTDYVVYGIENEWITTNIEDGTPYDEGYKRGYSDGFLENYKGLAFTALEDGCAISLGKHGNIEYPNMQYSIDKNPFQNWDGSELVIANGHTIYLKGDNPNGLGNTGRVWIYFITSGRLKVSGDITSLFDDGKGTTTSLPEHAFKFLFEGTSIVDASELQLKLVSRTCYLGLFRNSLLIAPPKLPSTTLASSCYMQMFSNCSSLTITPELPATTLQNNCYENMFRGCKSLTTAPILPAPILINYCYYGMFEGCSNLASVITYATDISASDCIGDFLLGVAEHGNFYNLGSAPYDHSPMTLVTGAGIPYYWTEYRLQPYPEITIVE